VRGHVLCGGEIVNSENRGGVSTVRPLIGVTPGWAGPNPNRDFGKTADILYSDINYLRRIEEAGGLPLLLPHCDEPGALDQLADSMDGLLFTGGEDVDPAHYSQDVHPQTVVAEARDNFEIRLFRAFFETGKPILAICRGIQLINVALGGSLLQDLPSQTGSSHHSQKVPTGTPTHEVQLLESSRLARTFGLSVIEVNSHHHQAVDTLGDGLQAVGWSEDGIVEAVEHTHHAYLTAVQWHPERLLSRMEIQRKLFDSFITACREQRAV
jgi:putative glutamine amidotransferase